MGVIALDEQWHGPVNPERDAPDIGICKSREIGLDKVGEMGWYKVGCTTNHATLLQTLSKPIKYPTCMGNLCSLEKRWTCSAKGWGVLILPLPRTDAAAPRSERKSKHLHCKFSVKYTAFDFLLFRRHNVLIGEGGRSHQAL